MKPIPILMPTAPRYTALAQWTQGQISKFWPEHPRIYCCGAERVANALPLRDDPKDWMRVVASACADLLADGIEYTYVILDDHAPIARCHERHLRETLPAMAREMDVTCLMTLGYGPVLPRKGTMVPWNGFHPERLPISEPWKLPLHPALWNLRKFSDILEHLIRHLPEAQHTPWAFERIGSDPEKGGISTALLSACWRIGAWEMSTPEARGLHDIRDRLLRLMFRASTIKARALGGAEARAALQSALSGAWHPRIGPYPVFWSGVMKKGRINADYSFYAKLKGRPELTAGLQEAFDACAS
ncbi:MAG: hypothetical protein ABI615_05625 [Chthoniobacterales bacterium]